MKPACSLQKHTQNKSNTLKVEFLFITQKNMALNWIIKLVYVIMFSERIGQEMKKETSRAAIWNFLPYLAAYLSSMVQPTVAPCRRRSVEHHSRVRCRVTLPELMRVINGWFIHTNRYFISLDALLFNGNYCHWMGISMIDSIPFQYCLIGRGRLIVKHTYYRMENNNSTETPDAFKV